jgi:hypothetical protein
MLKIDCPPLPAQLQAHLVRRQGQNHRWNSLRSTAEDKEIKASLQIALFIESFIPKRRPKARKKPGNSCSII